MMENARSFHERFRVDELSNEYYRSSELSVMKKTSENSCSYTINDCCTSLEHFIFPPPPHLEVPPGDPERKCFNNKEGSPSSSDDVDSNSDSSQSDNFPLVGNSGYLKSSKNAIFKLRGYFNDFNSPVSNILSMLPPIGVFWDIENCQVPKGRSAVVIAQAIRDKFFHGYRETEFLVVCDVKKENSQVIQELNDAQVNLIHVSSQSKNAADDKLRQAMRRFADIHGPPAAIMLISGDINFSSDLCDLRHRKKIHVILLHNDLCSQSLILCANEHHNYSKLVETLPLRGSENLQSNNPVEVLVTNLPLGYDPAKIRNKLKRLSENCGGRVGIITDQTTTIRFSSMEFATRAQKRMNRERVFGNSVFVSTPYNVTDDQDFNKIYGRKPNFCKSAEHNSVVTNNKIYHFSNSENFVPIPPDYTMNATKYTLFHDKCPCPYPNGNHKENTSPPWLHPRIPPNRTEITDAVSRPILRPRDQNTPLLPNPCHGGVIQIHSWPFEPVKILPRPPVSVNVSDMDRRCFHPISSSSPVELHITNLDQNMDLAELRKSLLNAFSEFTTVLNLSVYVQSDGNYAASIRVRSQQDAQFVISRLHRQKIGYKRIMISYAHNGNGHNIALIRSQTISLLSDVPGNQLPFIKFRELYEKRFLFSPNASDFNKIRDVCTISNEANGRIISLKEEFRNSPSPLLSLNNDNAVPIEQSFCNKHWKPTKINNDKGWAELEVMTLPNVKIELASFSKNLHHLVSSHSNYLLLTSLCDCYEAEYGTLVFDDNGVPLEHLVTCVSGLELVTNNNTGIKYITSAVARASLDDRKSEGSHSLQDGNHCISPSLASNLALFSRELVDLLKTFPHCMMSFNRFIPAYHHHFGRQCRVADYGYTKLIDLMEALPNVVQVIGEGNRRMMTLAHKAQIRRFTSDLLRVLKSLASKQTTIGEFPTLFEKTMNRVFDPIDYGLCYLEDLLSQISENTIVINPPSGADENYDRSNTVIAIPKREQTAEEIEKTKVFATEVIELLSHAPQCSMLFNKFIPAYHHHYGHQCKVADFGFTKLIELFEAIPDIVKIEEDIEGGDRKVTLREEVKLKVLGEQLVSLVMSHRPNELSLANLSSVFLWQYGYSLKPSAYGFQSLEELIQNLNFAVKVVNTPSGAILQAIDKNQLKFLSLKTKRVLIERSQTGKMLFKEFSKAFAAMFGETIELQIIENELSNAITVIRNDNVGDSIIKLNPLEMFARDVYWLMLMSNGRLPLNSFENTYLSMYGTAVQPAVYGFQTLPALLQAIPHTIVIRGKPPKRLILLNSDLASVGFRFPKSLITTNRAAPHPVGDENIPCVTLPVLTLHPDVYNVTTELTSPVKILNNAIFAEQMLHAPVSGIETPSPFRVPFPAFLNGYNSSNSSSGQFHDCRSNQNGTTASSDGCNYIAQNSEISADDQPTSESMESSTDSFSDGTVSSTNKRKIRLAAQFQGYSES